jgi:hypothetical protein
MRTACSGESIVNIGESADLLVIIGDCRDRAKTGKIKSMVCRHRPEPPAPTGEQKRGCEKGKVFNALRDGSR